MSFRRALRWTLPPLSLLALSGWLASSPLAQRTQQTAAPQMSGTGPAAESSSAAGPDRLSAVQKFVAQKNAESSRQQEEFVRAGWTIVQAPPPDPQLIALDPSLLRTREAELRQQIATTTVSGDQAAHLATIAREAQQEATQVAAVEALGRIRSDEAQEQLEGLLHTLPDGTLARREVAPLLRPRDLSDSRAAKLAMLLDDSGLNAVERKQIAFTLSLVGLRDQSQLPSGVLEQLSSSVRSLLAQTTSLARLDRSTP